MLRVCSGYVSFHSLVCLFLSFFVFSYLYFCICIWILYLSLGLPCWPPEAAYGIIGGMGTPWRAKTFVPQNLNASPPDQNGLYFSHTSLKSFVSQFFVQLNSHPNDDGKSYQDKGESDNDNDKEDGDNLKDIDKHCQRHYGPRRWLLWPVILVW